MNNAAREALQAEYWDTSDLERVTGTSKGTWRYWGNTGTGPEGFPPSFKLGRRRLWERASVIRWLEEQQEAAAV